MARRGYPPEFRKRVIELVEGGRRVAEVAAERVLSENLESAHGDTVHDVFQRLGDDR